MIIDLSTYNNIVDWKRIKADSSIDGAILKITNKSNRLDSKYLANSIFATICGVKLGAYKYVYAQTVKDAEAEAKAIVKYLNPKCADLGVWLDIEDASLRSLTQNQLRRVIEAETKILRDAGFHVGIYCSYDWYKNVLSDEVKDRYFFWIARYNSNINIHDMKSITNCIMWQFTSKHLIDGVGGYVDASYPLFDIEFMMKEYA